ncbi:MAG: hypothetical protein LBK00_02235 [Treponema sp.]|nr:hypothetical protein [Treponema sp.]
MIRMNTTVIASVAKQSGEADACRIAGRQGSTLGAKKTLYVLDESIIITLIALQPEQQGYT